MCNRKNGRPGIIMRYVYSTGFHIIKEHLLHFDLSEDKITNFKKLACSDAHIN
jgi:hypothetical protein